MIVDKEFADKITEVSMSIGKLFEGRKFDREILFCGVIYYLYNLQDDKSSIEEIYRQLEYINKFMRDRLRPVKIN